MSNISLQQASTVVDAAIAKARDMGLKPLTVAVLDAGGHLVAFKREDKSSLLRGDIATGKAWGSLGMGASTRTLGERALANPSFFGALSDLSGGKILTSPGGVIIQDQDGEVIGAVGASGDTGPNDEVCVIAGIEQADLLAIV